MHEREGRVVSRSAQLRDVWGYDWSGGSNVVEVVISALRRKLGDSAGSLQTVRGTGYRFTAPPRPRPGAGADSTPMRAAATAVAAAVSAMSWLACSPAINSR